MAPIPRYRHHEGIVILSAGFRPFFLLAALWACAVVPASVGFITGAVELPTAFPPLIWHVHEMVFGYGSAVVAGFLLTAIPNWTGRLPLQGGPLAALLLACLGLPAALAQAPESPQAQAGARWQAPAQALRQWVLPEFQMRTYIIVQQCAAVSA